MISPEPRDLAKTAVEMKRELSKDSMDRADVFLHLGPLKG